MISNAEKNYYINVPLTIIGFACLISGFLIGDKSLSFGGINMRSLHVWTGYIMTGLIVLHLVMHVKWIKNITLGIFQNRLKVISLATMVLISLGICYATGIIGPKGNEQGHFPREQNQRMDQFNQDGTNLNNTNSTQ
ncbi:DUF4405 domain-containing protein [Desulfosporosinus sp. Sb-LF]|uniref:DUF4405 domain-containing protein n=1 Tax=Desulfosporosinus sp. Sb-LF TaxID=2560027 RepID=UPI0013052247|nr:DUF4405 domain-containing protein [Desulfosporosinus sp. Sb-LF]